MNFQWALDRMREGDRVRRSEWKSEKYWYMRHASIIDERHYYVKVIDTDVLLSNDWEPYVNDEDLEKAAPEMLKCLKQLVGGIHASSTAIDAVYRRAYNAIARAEGREVPYPSEA